MRSHHSVWPFSSFFSSTHTRTQWSFGNLRTKKHIKDFLSMCKPIFSRIHAILCTIFCFTLGGKHCIRILFVNFKNDNLKYQFKKNNKQRRFGIRYDIGEWLWWKCPNLNCHLCPLDPETIQMKPMNIWLSQVRIHQNHRLVALNFTKTPVFNEDSSLL